MGIYSGMSIRGIAKNRRIEWWRNGFFCRMYCGEKLGNQMAFK